MPIPIKVGLIGGSGLDNPDLLKNREEKTVTTVYGDPSDVLIEGEIEGVPCVLLARHGRKHDIMPSNINYRANIWALKEAGCTHVLVSSACGSLKEEIKPGDLVIPNNFIDRTQGRKQSFYDGQPGSPPGILHLPMEPAYSESLREHVINTANKIGLQPHKEGTVVVIEGPRFSSKSESKMYMNWGGDLVNMTAVPELILAKEAGLLYTTIALSTDYDCWREHGEKVSHSYVIRTFQKNSEKVVKLMRESVKDIGLRSWDKEIDELRTLIKESVM